MKDGTAQHDRSQWDQSICTDNPLGLKQSREQRKRQRLSDKYFEVESCLKLLLKAREIRKDNTWLELLIKATSRESASLYVMFRKLYGVPPLAVQEVE